MLHVALNSWAPSKHWHINLQMAQQVVKKGRTNKSWTILIFLQKKMGTPP